MGRFFLLKDRKEQHRFTEKGDLCFCFFSGKGI